MSRIGRAPITIPAGVDVSIDGNIVTVKGPKGTLTQEFHKDMIIKSADGVITVSRPSEEKIHKSLHGLTRTLVNNMVVGVTVGFSKDLEINGVGYRAAKQGNTIVMNLGYSHQVIIAEIPGITIDVPAPNKIKISGSDKQKVGQFAAELREKRPPEPYKGKGIKYIDEIVRRKEGKAGKGAKGGKK
jgi:large subunit ribosomal protein L6